MGINRIFLDWSRPLLPQAADYLLDRFASEDDLNLGNVTLVFPGRRGARRMLELLVQKAQSPFPAWTPPQLITFAQFPELLYEQQLKLANDMTQLLAWREALRRVPRHETQDAFPHLPEPDAFQAWLSLCQQLRKQHNELAADGKEFDEIVVALEQFGLPAESHRWQALRRIQAEYLMQMDQLGLWDRQAARLIAVQQQECSTEREIILVGTVDMNLIVRQMIDQIADQVTTLVHAPESHSEYFDEHGCVIPGQWEGYNIDLPLDTCHIVDRPSDQAGKVVELLASKQNALTPDAVTIGVANDALVPLIRQALSDAGVAARWPVGMQIRSTRPCRLLQAVVTHLSSAASDGYLRFSTLRDLVRHPDLFRLISGKLAARGYTVDWLSLLDAYCATTVQMTPAVLPGGGEDRDVVRAILRSVTELLQQLVESSPASGTSGPRKPRSSGQRNSAPQQLLDFDADAPEAADNHTLLARRPLTDWAQGVLRLLQFLYKDHELTDAVTDRGLVEFVANWERILTELESVPSAIVPKCSAAAAIQFLIGCIADEIIPSEDEDDAIDLLGWLELPQDDSNCLIVTGFNEGHIPESVTSDIFLPNSLRERTGLTDNRRRYARDAYALTAILHSAPDVSFVAGRFDDQNNPLTPSRLYFAAAADSLVERVNRFYQPDASPSMEDVTPQTTNPEAPAKATDHSGFTIPPIPADLPEPTEIPVSSFRDYLHCPYRYALVREMRLKEVEDEALELDARSFGTLLHAVLNRFAESTMSAATEPEAIRDFLRRELAEIARYRFGTLRSAAVNVQLSMAEVRLDAFAKWQATAASEGWRIRYSEEDRTCEQFLDAKDRPVKIVGRIDRIDQLRDTNTWRILDYKTSESATPPNKTHRRSNGEWTDLQLPLYRLLTESLNLRGDIQLGYVHLPNDSSKAGVSLADWSDSDFEDAEETARQVAASILDLRLDAITRNEPSRLTPIERICQSSVVDPRAPWLDQWTGRETTS